MSEESLIQPKTKLRWFQYSLRSLLLFVTVVAVVVSLVTWLCPSGFAIGRGKFTPDSKQRTMYAHFDYTVIFHNRGNPKLDGHYLFKKKERERVYESSMAAFIKHLSEIPKDKEVVRVVACGSELSVPSAEEQAFESTVKGLGLSYRKVLMCYCDDEITELYRD